MWNMCNKWTYFVLPYTILANVDTDCGEFENVANVGGKDCMTMYENTICKIGGKLTLNVMDTKTNTCTTCFDISLVP